MKIERFHSLSMPQQYYYAMKCGTYLLTRHERQFSVDLYDVSGYYVEVYYENGATTCSLIRSFLSTIFLDSYLRTIDLTVLLEQ